MSDVDWRVTLVSVESSTGRICDATFCIREHQNIPGADPLDASTVASDLADWLKTAWTNTMTTDLELERVNVRELGTDSPTTADEFVHMSGALSGGTQVLPWPVCAIGSIKTALATRSGRGHFHFPPAANATALATRASFNLAGTYYGNCTTFLEQLMAGHDVTHDLQGHHYSLRVWSRKLQTSHDVTSGIVRAQPGYVRSRWSVP